jgi:hypothetical protein
MKIPLDYVFAMMCREWFTREYCRKLGKAYKYAKVKSIIHCLFARELYYIFMTLGEVIICGVLKSVGNQMGCMLLCQFLHRV